MGSAEEGDLIQLPFRPNFLVDVDQHAAEDNDYDPEIRHLAAAAKTSPG
ncbi:hypothetical protein [Leptolyngbya sp. O-77]|nr:hypothetical protein [Leptolyngbya sp. O-77]